MYFIEQIIMDTLADIGRATAFPKLVIGSAIMGVVAGMGAALAIENQCLESTNTVDADGKSHKEFRFAPCPAGTTIGSSVFIGGGMFAASFLVLLLMIWSYESTMKYDGYAALGGATDIYDAFSSRFNS